MACFSYRSLRREDRVRKANKESQLNDVDSARTRDTVRDGEIVRKEIETSGVMCIWGSRLKSAPQRVRRVRVYHTMPVCDQ